MAPNTVSPEHHSSYQDEFVLDSNLAPHEAVASCSTVSSDLLWGFVLLDTGR